MNRRSFLQLSASAALLAPVRLRADDTDLDSRIRGLMFGTAIGDALGGPIEFQSKEKVERLFNPPKTWHEGEVLDGPARTACSRRLELRAYHDLRPKPESYGHWEMAPGTVTDDTRHKLVFLQTLASAETKGSWPIGVEDLAQAYLDWPARPAIAERPEYQSISADWLEEWQFAARWVIGERDLEHARPPERMWQSLPTCCGQMTLLPLAALFPGAPQKAYRAAWSLAFFDNGFGRDMNAALVAALAQALVTPASEPRLAWEHVLATLRNTDPFEFRRIRYTQRPVHRWLDFALRAAKEAKGEPAHMFEVFEKEFATNAKWEAQVPFAVMIGCLALADYQPLPALQLCMEWGHDTDSYAQLLGAFIGALHGVELFRSEWRSAVADRLKADFHVDLEEECWRLVRLRRLSEKTVLIRDE